MTYSPEISPEIPLEPSEGAEKPAELRTKSPIKTLRNFSRGAKLMIGLQALGLVGGIGLNQEKAEAKGLPKELIGVVANELAQGLTKSEAQDSLEASERASDGELGFDKDDRLLIDDEDIEILGNSAIGERDLQIILRDNISTILKDLGFTSVATRSQLRKESQERAEERANREVAQPTVPESGTVPREEVEVRPSVQIIRSKKDLESLFGWGRNIFSISGFDIKSSETVIAINLGFFNNKTQMDLARLVIVGKEKDFDRVRIGSLSFGGLDLERRDPQQGQEARALAACLQNLEKILSEKLEAQERKAGQIGEIIGVKGNLVSIDLGKENNVEVGMRFTVDGTLKAEKGEDFPVPDLATLVVISVSETENQATCRVVGPLNEHGNPIFSMVPGYTVRPETPTAEEPAEEAPSPASSPESGGAQEV